MVFVNFFVATQGKFVASRRASAANGKQNVTIGVSFFYHVIDRNSQMDSRQAIKTSIGTADMISNTYLEDLTDDEMMKRPDPGCNHLKWQVGHLIASDHGMISGCVQGALPDLPEGFAEKYSKEQAASDNPDDFHSKAELMSVFETQRSAILNTLANMTDEDFDQPAPESMQSYAANVGAVFSMIGSHWLMHTGQWVVVRRQLGRDVLI